MSRNLLLLLWIRSRERPSAALGLLMALVTVCVLANTLIFWGCEGGGEDGPGFGDALWYSVISITTIGYGDYSASSLWSRLATVLFIVVVGLGTFSVIIGLVFDRMAAYFERGKKGMNQIMFKDHILVINFPDRVRVARLIEELREDTFYARRDIVIVTDDIDELPFVYEHVYFVRGSPLEVATLHQANLLQAATALVLATGRPESSDAMVAAQVLLIESLKPEIYTVAECMRSNHRHLFAINHCDSIVCSNQVGDNLLVQELQDRGISRTIEVVTSNRLGTTVYSAAVTDGRDASYQELAKGLLDRDANLLSVNRDDEVFTTFRDLWAAAGDRVVYVSQRRYTWDELVRMAGEQAATTCAEA